MSEEKVRRNSVGESLDCETLSGTGHPGYFGEVTRAVAIDHEGNVVLVGHYEGTPGDMVDFDPTQGVVTRI